VTKNIVTSFILNSRRLIVQMRHNLYLVNVNSIENLKSHPAASRILPITEKQRKANEAAERRSIMARSAAVNESAGSNSTANETTIVLGENCDETNVEV